MIITFKAERGWDDTEIMEESSADVQLLLCAMLSILNAFGLLPT